MSCSLEPVEDTSKRLSEGCESDAKAFAAAEVLRGLALNTVGKDDDDENILDAASGAARTTGLIPFEKFDHATLLYPRPPLLINPVIRDFRKNHDEGFDATGELGSPEAAPSGCSLRPCVDVTPPGQTKYNDDVEDIIDPIISPSSPENGARR